MIYIEHKPTFQLSQWVEKIWYCSADDLTTVQLTIPLLYHELVINFSDNYCIRKAGETVCAIENPIAWVHGLQTKAYYTHSSGKHEMVGVLFKPCGLHAFLKDHSSEFADTFIDAHLIFDRRFKTLVHKIQEAPIPHAKIALVENFLIENIIEVQVPKYLQYSIRQLPARFGAKGSIVNLCKQMSVSNKSLIKAFSKHVGVNPMRYAHMLAINSAVFELSQEPGQSLTALAYKLNFSDQAHFTKLFKSITSLTPSQYSVLVINKQTEVGTPNFIVTPG